MVLKGNCDAEVDEMISQFMFFPTLSLNVGGKTVFLSHGHNFNIDSLPEGNFDIMFYGHFHTCFIKEQDGKIFVNPGSISLPKNDTPNSYAVLTDDEMWILCDLMTTYYTLKKTAELFRHGYSYQTQKAKIDKLQSPMTEAMINKVLLPEVFKKIEQLLTP